MSFENVFNFEDLNIKAWPSIINFVCSVNKTFYETYFVKVKCKTGLIKKQARICRFMISRSF